jgi:small-conductance mechanosensitive channel
MILKIIFLYIDLIHSICELLVIWGVFGSIIIFFFWKIDKLFKLYEKANKIAHIKYKKEKRNIKITLVILTLIYLIMLTLINLLDYQLQIAMLLYTIFVLTLIYFNISSIKDYINGYRILNEDKFRVGDLVKINDIVGEVIKIGLKSIIILNNEESVIAIPNNEINLVEITSITKEIAKYDFLISYDTNLEKVEILLKLMTKEIEKSIKGIENKVSYMVIGETDDNMIIYRIKVPVKKESKYIIQGEIRKLIHKSFKKENIDLIEVNHE